MNDLVVLHNKIPMVSSLLVAKKFGKVHAKVMVDIGKLHCSNEFTIANYRKSEFTNERGRSYECVMMTRDGFSFLCMGWTGKEAGQWKEAYIKAFNQMEQKLLHGNVSQSWLRAREQSKLTRRSVTDTIKDFIDYCEHQGSQNSKRYYSNITKMEYKALGMIEGNGKVPDNFRDTLNNMELSFLVTAEYVARQAIILGMDQGLDYHDIYAIAKEKVIAYANTVMIKNLGAE